MAWALTNTRMADEQRAALAPDDAEFQLRFVITWVEYPDQDKEH